MKSRIKNYLTISKKEWNGMVILVILIAGVLAAPYVYQVFRKDNTINYKEFDKALAQLSKAGYLNNDTSSNGLPDRHFSDPVRFPFNPNLLSIKQWRQLGLSDRQAKTIKHYEAKGGRFYTRADLKKIYGISADDYKRLEPYIVIPETASDLKKLKSGEIIELNRTDSAKLTKIKGIGPSFAVQIIRYRNRLGGFVNIEQLMEVYGMDTATYATIKGRLFVNPGGVKKLHINNISFNQLRIFPYFSYKQVNAIIAYRNQHGNYQAIADLKNIPLLDDKILRKIEPYLTFE